MTLLSVGATSGFLDLPTCNGQPTAIPDNLVPGASPSVYDQFNGVLWVFDQSLMQWVGASMPYPMAACRGHVVQNAAFSPASLSLDGHWEAGVNTFSDNGTTPASSGLIYRWNKASGSGPDLVQATSGNRGSLGTVSGKPAMQFDDTARKYTLSSNIDVASNGSFVVMVAGSFVDLEDQLLWYSATNNSQIRVCENGNARTISASTSATPAVLSPSTSNFASPCVLTWVVSSGAIEFFIGHTSLGTASFDVSAGFRFEDFGFLPAVNLNGNIYGLAIKKAASGAALSSTQISNLIDYFTGLMP